MHRRTFRCQVEQNIATAMNSSSIAMPSLNKRKTKMECRRLDKHSSTATYGGHGFVSSKIVSTAAMDATYRPAKMNCADDTPGPRVHTDEDGQVKGQRRHHTVCALASRTQQDVRPRPLLRCCYIVQHTVDVHKT